MDRIMVAAFIFAAITVAVIAQGWVSWLDHQRRSKTLDVIKAALEAGKEPPKELYAQLENTNAYASMGMSKRPWGEAVVFGAVGIGFWILFGFAEPDDRDKILLVATIMSAMSIGCFALAIFRPGQKPNDDGR